MKKDRGPVRISDWLQRELNVIKGAALSDGLPQPSKADLLDEAWRHYKKSEQSKTSDIEKSDTSASTTPPQNRAISDSVLKTEQLLTVNSTERSISTEEHSWIEALLEVLRSESAGAADAIKSNLQCFVKLVRLARKDVVRGGSTEEGNTTGDRRVAGARTMHSEHAGDAPATPGSAGRKGRGGRGND